MITTNQKPAYMPFAVKLEGCAPLTVRSWEIAEIVARRFREKHPGKHVEIIVRERR